MKQILIYGLVCLLCSCGNLRSIYVVDRKLVILPGQTVAIVNYDCNSNECHTIDNNLHHVLQTNLENYLGKNGIQIVDKKMNHDYEIVIVSAHEEDIHREHPRNVFLIIRDQQKREYLQIGIAEEFSTPMTHQYLDLDRVSERLHQHLSVHVEKPTLAILD